MFLPNQVKNSKTGMWVFKGRSKPAKTQEIQPNQVEIQASFKILTCEVNLSSELAELPQKTITKFEKAPNF